MTTAALLPWVIAEDLYRQVISPYLGFGSFGDLSRDELGFCFPGGEGSVSYPPMWTAGIGNSQSQSPVNPFPNVTGFQPQAWATRFPPAAVAFVQRYELLTVTRQAASFTEFVRWAWRAARQTQLPEVRHRVLAAVEQVSLDVLASAVRRDPDRVSQREQTPPSAGIPTWIDVFTGKPGMV